MANLFQLGCWCLKSWKILLNLFQNSYQLGGKVLHKQDGDSKEI